MSNNDGIGNIMKRELIRAMMERTQGLDMKDIMHAFGVPEHA